MSDHAPDRARVGAWIQTYTGRKFHLADPEPSSVHITDIAIGLSRIPRFTGHTRDFYSVAQHSCLVESLMPSDTHALQRLVALLHDAHEAYIGDLSSPLKWLLRDYANRDVLGLIERNIQRAIHAAFRIHNMYPARYLAEQIKHADLLALAVEKRDLMAPSPESWIELPSPDGVPVVRVISQQDAAAAFVRRAAFLLGDIGFGAPMRSLGL